MEAIYQHGNLTVNGHRGLGLQLHPKAVIALLEEGHPFSVQAFDAERKEIVFGATSGLRNTERGQGEAYDSGYYKVSRIKLTFEVKTSNHGPVTGHFFMDEYRLHDATFLPHKEKILSAAK